MSVDYKKLLEICMFKWFQSEGVCWGGENDKDWGNDNSKDTDFLDNAGKKAFDKLTKEEEKAAMEIFEKSRERYDKLYNRTEEVKLWQP